MLRSSVFILLTFALVLVARADQSNPGMLSFNQDVPAANAPATSVASPPATGAPSSSAESPPILLHEAMEALQDRQIDEALAKVNKVIQIDPQNVDGYGLRGGIYAAQKQWAKAIQDYQKILQLDPANAQAKFNMAEISFLQKKYDEARPGFIAMEKDPNLGDLATYKVFLCDLFGGHADMAAKELQALDQVGSGASYYFAEAASSLYQKKPEDARGWLTSASNIYSPAKFKLYSASLFDLGYLPLPPAPAAN
jgi:Tfp pilus assembly protein PilF